MSAAFAILLCHSSAGCPFKKRGAVPGRPLPLTASSTGHSSAGVELLNPISEHQFQANLAASSEIATHWCCEFAYRRKEKRAGMHLQTPICAVELTLC